MFMAETNETVAEGGWGLNHAPQTLPAAGRFTKRGSKFPPPDGESEAVRTGDKWPSSQQGRPRGNARFLSFDSSRGPQAMTFPNEIRFRIPACPLCLLF